MVNRPKYDDFVQVGSTTKRFHDTDVSFVQFSCPMDGCNELVNVRDDEVERIHHFFQDFSRTCTSWRTRQARKSSDTKPASPNRSALSMV